MQQFEIPILFLGQKENSRAIPFPPFLLISSYEKEQPSVGTVI